MGPGATAADPAPAGGERDAGPSVAPDESSGPASGLARHVVDAAPDGVLVVDHAGTIVLANPAAGRILGYDLADLVGRPVDVLVPEPVREAHRAHRTRFLADPRTRPMGIGLELRARRRDGAEVPVEISLSPLRLADGAAVVVVMRDVGERREAEERMRRLQRLLDATRDGMFVFEVDTLALEYVNQGAADQLGRTREELLGRPVHELQPELTEELVRAELAPLLEGRVAVRSLAAVAHRTGGAELSVEVLLQVPADAAGRRDRCVAVVRDVSARRHSEATLQRTHDALVRAEDRERIARDLHDTVIQRIFATGLLLQATVGAIGPGEAGDRVEQAVEELDATIQEIRTAIFALHNPVGAAEGVRHDVLTLTADAARGLGFGPRVVFDGPVDTRVTGAIRAEMIPALREALTNVARHAGATAVTVRVEALGDEMGFVVEDDGHGLPAVVTGGHGLANMAHRAAALGGTCEVTEAAGHGVIVTWRVPRPA